jgi:hypothetical protein
MAKTWTKQEIIDLMMETVVTVRSQCLDLGQAFRIKDAIEQIYEDLNSAGLIEHEP